MAKGTRHPGETDPDAGIWQGRSIARVAESPDGMIVLVGRTARDNDVLSIKLASSRDFWFHVSGESGSHVVVRNPDNLQALPRETKRFAAGLAADAGKPGPGSALLLFRGCCLGPRHPAPCVPARLLKRGVAQVPDG